MPKEKVTLYVYDLTKGLIPQQFVTMLNGIQGIYHTSIVVYGVEYYYSGGIQKTGMPGTTHFGVPTRKEEMGETQIPKDVFEGFLDQIGRNQFRMELYDLFKNNCNHFTNQCTQFLLSKDIPDEIKNLPSQFLASPLGQMAKPFLDQMMGGIQESLNQGHGGTQQNQSSTTQSGNQTIPTGSQQTGQQPFGTGQQPFGTGQQPFGTGQQPFGGFPSMGNMGNMNEMLQNPQVQQLLRNPQVMQQAMSNPMVQAQMAQMGVDQDTFNRALNDPFVQQMLQDPQMMQQAMQMMQSGNMGQGFGQFGQNQSSSGNQSTNQPFFNPYASSTPTPPPKKTLPPFQDKKEIFRFKKGKVSAIIEKMRNDYNLNRQQLEIVSNIEKFFVDKEKDLDLINESTWKLLIFLISTIEEKQSFPILDCIRLLVLNPQLTKQAKANNVFTVILQQYLKDWKNLSMPSQLMILRIFCNIFQSSVYKEKNIGVAHELIQGDEDLFSQLSDMVTDTISTSKLDGLRLTAASLAANISLFAKKDNNDCETQLLCSMLEFISEEKKTDIAQVMLLTIARLLTDNPNAVNLVKELDGKRTIESWKKKTKRDDALSLVEYVLGLLG